MNQVKCNTRKGYGTSAGRTMIRVANWGWTSPRMDIAKKLVQLKTGLQRAGDDQPRPDDQAGAEDPADQDQARARSRSTTVVDANNDGFACAVRAPQDDDDQRPDGSRDVKITWTGSQNFTRPGTMTNTDIVLRIVDPRVTAAYEKNFAYIRGKATKRLKRCPGPSA